MNNDKHSFNSLGEEQSKDTKNGTQSQLIQEQLLVFDELSKIEVQLLALKLKKEKLKLQQANINNLLVKA